MFVFSSDYSGTDRWPAEKLGVVIKKVVAETGTIDTDFLFFLKVVEFLWR